MFPFQSNIFSITKKNLMSIIKKYYSVMVLLIFYILLSVDQNISVNICFGLIVSYTFNLRIVY